MAADDRARLRRSQGLWAVVALVGLVMTLYGAVGSFTTLGAWGYTNAPTTTVRVGSDCELTLTRRGDGGGVDCPATWRVDGEQVSGTLTTKNGGELPEPGEATIEARVYGDTARTSLDEYDRLFGLVAPGVLLVGLVLLVLGRRNDKRAEAALAQLPPEPLRVGGPRGGGSRVATRGTLRDRDLLRLAQERELGGVRTVHQVPLGLTGPALSVVAVVVLVVLLPGVLRWIVLVVGLLWLALLAYATLTALRTRSTTALLEDGVVDRHQNTTVAVRYDELDGAWTETSGSARAYRLRARDGAEVVIGPDRGGHAALGEQVLDEASRSAVPVLRHRVSVGGEALFGPLTATAAGLAFEGRFVPWAQLDEVVLEPEPTPAQGQRVVVRWGEHWWSINEDQVPWARTLVALVPDLQQDARA